jgi:hypothetical protein
MFGVPFPVNLRVIRALFFAGLGAPAINPPSQTIPGPLLPESSNPHPTVITPSLAIGLEVFKASKHGLCVAIGGVQARACVFRDFFMRTPSTVTGADANSDGVRSRIGRGCDIGSSEPRA